MKQKAKDRSEFSIVDAMAAYSRPRNGAITLQFRKASQPRWDINYSVWSSNYLRPGSSVEVDGSIYTIVEVCWTSVKHAVVMLSA